MNLLRRLATRAAYDGPLWPFFVPRYRYMFSPRQLSFLIDQLDRVREVDGVVVEVGCARGDTMVFLNEHLRSTGRIRPYVCIDTFSGFLPEDVAYESGQRGKDAAAIASLFALNRREWVAKAARLNGFDNVQVVRSAAQEFDFASLGPIAFALIDVDLYRPVLHALEAIWPQLPRDGVVCVDDCREEADLFDGARQAYSEFGATHGLPTPVHCGKLGLFVKP